VKKFKPTKQQITRVENWVVKWHELLNLQEWECQKIKFCPEQEQNNPSWDVAISSDYVYLNFSIDIYPSLFKCSITGQEKLILHELCHTFSRHLMKLAYDGQSGILINSSHIIDVTETLTQKISRVIWKVHNS